MLPLFPVCPHPSNGLFSLVCCCCFLLVLIPLLCVTETMESELIPILMQDTVGFVMKLKRLVIYECERSALQQRFAT